MTHTPAPWIIPEHDKCAIKTAQNAPIAYAFKATRSKGEQCANARLIAAAPDMLAALKDIVARNEIQHWFNLDLARAAIARAEGSKP